VRETILIGFAEPRGGSIAALLILRHERNPPGGALSAACAKLSLQHAADLHCVTPRGALLARSQERQSPERMV
jgi:hypothetical protein